MALQMFSDKGHQSILTAPTASSGWKNVRKGVMPAFSPQNIRFAWQFFSFLLLRHAGAAWGWVSFLSGTLHWGRRSRRATASPASAEGATRC